MRGLGRHWWSRSTARSEARRRSFQGVSSRRRGRRAWPRVGGASRPQGDDRAARPSCPTPRGRGPGCPRARGRAHGGGSAIQGRLNARSAWSNGACIATAGAGRPARRVGGVPPQPGLREGSSLAWWPVRPSGPGRAVDEARGSAPSRRCSRRSPSRSPCPSRRPTPEDDRPASVCAWLLPPLRQRACDAGTPGPSPGRSGQAGAPRSRNWPGEPRHSAGSSCVHGRWLPARHRCRQRGHARIGHPGGLRMIRHRSRCPAWFQGGPVAAGAGARGGTCCDSTPRSSGAPRQAMAVRRLAADLSSSLAQLCCPTIAVLLDFGVRSVRTALSGLQVSVVRAAQLWSPVTIRRARRSARTLRRSAAGRPAVGRAVAGRRAGCGAPPARGAGRWSPATPAAGRRRSR